MALFGKKPPPKPAAPSKAETDLKRQMAQMAAMRPVSKEDKLKEMIENDPEKAAALLREMFLKNK